METFDSPDLMKITPRPTQVMARGAGSYLWDEAGKRYLDFIQGWAVNCLGHCPAEISATLTRQGGQLITPSPALHNRPQLSFAQKLAELSGLQEVHFVNSGAEANEAAVKLARKWGQLHRGGASTIITTHNAFHGRTLAMMAASGKPGWDDLYPPNPGGFCHVPFGDVDAMATSIDQSTVAIMVEPIQGEAGVVMPPLDYLADLRALADKHGLLLILDEIQTGIGRTGALFGFEHEGVVPDILTLGKGLGGGVPLAAVLANERASCFAYGDQGGTYNGNPLMTAVGVEILSTVAQESFLAQVRQRGDKLMSGLATMAQRHKFLEVRGQGLLCAIRLGSAKAAAVSHKAFELGLLVNAARPDVVRFMPSLRVSEPELDEFFGLLDDSLAA